jgi:hypothetical protein
MRYAVLMDQNTNGTYTVAVPARLRFAGCDLGQGAQKYRKRNRRLYHDPSYSKKTVPGKVEMISGNRLLHEATPGKR